MGNSRLCPFCDAIIPITDDTKQSLDLSFDRIKYGQIRASDPKVYAEKFGISIVFIKCPKCDNHTIYSSGYSGDITGIVVPIHPRYTCRQFPDYVPLQIRQDYVEACSIKNISPKAAATLARRCIQGMIRDYWGIVKKTLHLEIEELKGKCPSDHWEAINCVRRIGNIGAHMEGDINIIVDIDPGEAEKLLQLVELLIDDWYVAREKRQLLIASIKSIDAEKQTLRK